jgi:hypothetical protein
MPRVDCVRRVTVQRSPRVMQLEGLFDLPPALESERRWQVELPLESRDWQLGLIVGPSGCGKSTLARELFGEAVVAGGVFVSPGVAASLRLSLDGRAVPRDAGAGPGRAIRTGGDR